MYIFQEEQRDFPRAMGWVGRNLNPDEFENWQAPLIYCIFCVCNPSFADPFNYILQFYQQVIVYGRLV